MFRGHFFGELGYFDRRHYAALKHDHAAHVRAAADRLSPPYISANAKSRRAWVSLFDARANRLNDDPSNPFASGSLNP
jgi:hypothetical protein